MKKWILLLIVCPLFTAQAKSSITTHVLDLVTLQKLENSGYSLSETLGGEKDASRTSELYQINLLYKSLADQIGQPIGHDAKTDQLPEVIPPKSGDIPEMVSLIRGFEDKGKRSDKDLKGGYLIRHLSNNSQYPYRVEKDGDEPRHFDYRWLNSKFGFFKLIAVANRIDRRDFNLESCGEVRFIYRLSYTSSKSSSTLPFFISVVHEYPKKDDCSEFARRWVEGQDVTGALKDLKFRQAEVNFQSLRFTSGYMHDFGGQAMYMQRIFRRKGQVLVPVELENTPDVLAIEKNPQLLQKFVAFIKEKNHLSELDKGTLLIDFDPRFLSKLSISWSTLGRARTANKPYSRIFENQEALLKSIDISGLKYIKSHEALVERLNNLTCMGCHQSSGTAGFHMLGYADPQFSHGFNKQELAISPHVFAEQFRREAYLINLVVGKKPNTFRPHSNFPKAVWQDGSGTPKFSSLSVGQMCALNKNTFAESPLCEEGLSCVETVSSQRQNVLFGECALKPAGRELAGAVCWKGEITEGKTMPKDRGPLMAYNLFAFQDKWKMRGGVRAQDKSAYGCVLPQSGAPLGRSSRACTVDEENFKQASLRSAAPPGEICGNQGGNGFDLCAASGDSGACLESRVVRSMLDTCYPGHFCREDYICQKFPDYQKISKASYLKKKNGKPVNQSKPEDIDGAAIAAVRAKQIGFCVPTYFLFNMRLDGHPSPMTGLPPGEPVVDRSQPLRGYK